MVLEPKKIKSATVSTFPSSICHDVVRSGVMNVDYKFVNSCLNVYVLSQFLNILSSPRGSLVLLCFLLLGQCNLHICGC